MANRLAGICYIKVDGAQFAVEGSVEVPLNETTKENLMSTSGPVGYSETARSPYVKFNGFLSPDLPVETINESTDMTLTVEFANGWVYTLSEAWLEGEINASPIEGTVQLEFHGMRGHLQQ